MPTGWRIPMINPIATINRILHSTTTEGNNFPSKYALTKYVLGDIGADLRPQDTAADFEYFLKCSSHFQHATTLKLLEERLVLLRVRGNTWRYLWELLKVLPESTEPTQKELMDAKYKLSAIEAKKANERAANALRPTMVVTTAKASHHDKREALSPSERLSKELAKCTPVSARERILARNPLKRSELK